MVTQLFKLSGRPTFQECIKAETPTTIFIALLHIKEVENKIVSLIASYHLLLEPSTAFQSQLSKTGWGQHVTCFSSPLPSNQFFLQTSCFVKQEPFHALCPPSSGAPEKGASSMEPDGAGQCRPPLERVVHATICRGSLCQTWKRRWLPAPIPRPSHRGYNANRGAWEPNPCLCQAACGNTGLVTVSLDVAEPVDAK